MDNEDQAKADTATPTAGKPDATASGAVPESKTTPIEQASALEEIAPVDVESYERLVQQAIAKHSGGTKDSETNARSAIEQDRIDSQAKAADEPVESQTPATDEATNPVESDKAAAPEPDAPKSESDEQKPDQPGFKPSPEDEEESSRQPGRIRLKGLKDGHLVAAANEIARAEGITFGEAWERVAPRKSEPTQAQIDASKESPPQLRARSEIEADIAKAKAEKREAAKNLDTEKMCDADERLEALKNELAAIDYSEQQAAVQAQQAFVETVQDARERAISNWPECADANSDFSKRMVEIADALEADPDPEMRAIVYDPDAPFVIAQMVAKEMGLLPARLRKTSSAKSSEPSASAGETAKKPVSVQQRAVGRPTEPAVSPASGAARTTGQGGSKGDPYGLDTIRSTYEYDKLLEQLKSGKLVAAK